MKGFFIFLSIVFLFLGVYIYYNVQHPTDTMMVRKGAQWTVLEHNMSK